MPNAPTHEAGAAVRKRIGNARVVWWDFDGVIKETIETKGRVFASLFPEASEGLHEKIKIHHAHHGGISRWQKLPLYLAWAGFEPKPRLVNQYAERFSRMIIAEVEKSAWVPGALEYLLQNHQRQRFFLVSATPQKELEALAKSLGIFNLFHSLSGWPTTKKTAIHDQLVNSGFPPEECLVIGDSLVDYEAARKNGVPFLLRSHPSNREEFRNLSVSRVMDFLFKN